MMTAQEDHSFVLGLIHLSTHQTLPTYLNYHVGNSFMLATESKRPRKSVSCPGADDQMDKPGLRRNQNHTTRGNYILPPASVRSFNSCGSCCPAEPSALKQTLPSTAFPQDTQHPGPLKSTPNGKLPAFYLCSRLRTPVSCTCGFSLENFALVTLPIFLQELSFWQLY